MCILFGYSPQVICHFLHKMDLVIFLTKANRYYIFCVRYSPTALANCFETVLYRWFGHGLNMYICFGYDPRIAFVTFSQIAFSRFLGVYYYQDMNVRRTSFFCFVYSVSLTYLFHDSS